MFLVVIFQVNNMSLVWFLISIALVNLLRRLNYSRKMMCIEIAADVWTVGLILLLSKDYLKIILLLSWKSQVVAYKS